MTTRLLLASALLIGLGAGAVTAQAIDPRGIYFNRFTGSFGGTEWFQVTPSGTSGTQFNLRDIYGGGFLGTINAAGQITISGATPGGAFSGPDNYVIFPFNGQFTFTCNRAPTTTPDFPLVLQSPRPANPLLAGQWFNTLTFFNPETGQVTGTGTELISITATGNNIRITDPGGAFFQGVFEDGLTAGFRVVNNPAFPPATGQYATFPGSSNNLGQDLLGELNLIDINTLRASFLLQTRVSLGNQTQTLIEFEATRVNPIAKGDANGDGDIDADDVAVVTALLGTTFEDNAYNLAADFDADGDIDGVDLAFLVGEFIDLGHQLSGNFAPTFTGSGSLAAGQGFTLTLADMPTSTTGFLFYSLIALNAPFKGGVLVPAPSLQFGFPTPALPSGTFPISTSLGAGIPSGTEIFLQAWFPDAGAPQGVSATNALLLRTP